jgi:anti-sigma factor RsiW
MTAAGEQHRLVSELLGAFALDAVDRDEARMVEEHLEECPRCRFEVDQLREVAAAIGNASERPPDSLWERIAGQLNRGDVERSPLPPTIELAGGRIEERRRVLGGRGGSAQPNRRERRRPMRGSPRRPWTMVGVGAAAACAALAAVFGVGWSNASGRAGQLQAALAERGTAAAVQAALASPGHRVVVLRSSTGAQLAEFVVRGNGVGYVVRSRMPELPGDETYQLWAEIANQPISLGLLGSKPALGDAFTLGPSVSSARALMVTVEPAGGVVTPDRAPVGTGSLS